MDVERFFTAENMLTNQRKFGASFQFQLITNAETINTFKMQGVCLSKLRTLYTLNFKKVINAIHLNPDCTHA